MPSVSSMPWMTGLKRLGCDRGAGQRGDRLRRRVGLLGAEAAVLDREVDRVAGGVDALDVAHPAVRVDADEAVLAERDAAHGGAVELGQRDDAVDLQLAVAGVDHDLAGARAPRRRRS